MKPGTLVWCCVLSLMLAGQAEASRYHVNGGAGSSGTGLSWGEAKKTVAEAMDLATNGDEVWVAAGTYSATTTHSLVVMKSGVSIYGGFAGTESSLAQSDPAANVTILDGANTCYQVVSANNITTGVLSGFTIQNGNYRTGRGAAIFINSCHPLTISNCVVKSNRGRMGGVCIQYSTGVKLRDCRVFNNVSTQAGGGVYIYNSSAEINHCTIAGNQTGTSGGGVYTDSGSVVWLLNSIVSANKAANGGGALIGGVALLIAKNCVISGNIATVKGGGIYNSQSRVNTFFCTIDGNSAPAGGGCFLSMGEIAMTVQKISNCIISNNSGAGVYCDYYAMPVLISSLFNANSPGDLAYVSTPYGSPTYITGASGFAGLGWDGVRDGSPAFDLTASASGTWSASPVYDNVTSTTYMACAASSLEPNALAGKILTPNTALKGQCYIVSNTPNSITVAGNAGSMASGGNAWQVMNYSLDIDSAAIDYGTTETTDLGSDEANMNVDITGTQRPVDVPGVGPDGTGSEYDMGAYEYTAAPVGPQVVVWLDFLWTDVEHGTEALPFNTLDEALAGVTDNGTIMIKPGAAAISKRITKHVRIEAPYGTARIGAN